MTRFSLKLNLFSISGAVALGVLLGMVSETLPVAIAANPQFAISPEFTATTVLLGGGGDGGSGGGSRESQFTTLPAPGDFVSAERTFVTLAAPEEALSAESSFTTLATPGGTGGPDGGGGGGGGGGRRGGSNRPGEPEPILPTACGFYITEYIKLGKQNDPTQVLKLQAFLRVYEGYEVPLSGVYDLTTYEAVKLFQLRYADDVLKPWGIAEPTGYVFITTSMAINNIVCGRDTDNPLTLRYPERFATRLAESFEADDIEGVIDLLRRAPEILLQPIDTDNPIPTSSEEVGATDRNFFQAAAAGLFDFINSYPLWWLGLILIIVAIILALLAWDKRPES